MIRRFWAWLERIYNLVMLTGAPVRDEAEETGIGSPHLPAQPPQR